MFCMSSQNTFGEKVRLNDKVESRVRGDLYARFGGECLETYHCNKWQGAGCLAYGSDLFRRLLLVSGGAAQHGFAKRLSPHLGEDHP